MRDAHRKMSADQRAAVAWLRFRHQMDKIAAAHGRSDREAERRPVLVAQHLAAAQGLKVSTTRITWAAFVSQHSRERFRQVLDGTLALAEAVVSIRREREQHRGAPKGSPLVRPGE
jgi:hypothetical protein